MKRCQAGPLRPAADRRVTVDGRTFVVRIRGRGLPARSFGSRGSVLVWLLWATPVWLGRRLTGRADCTVRIHESRPGWLGDLERAVHREHAPTLEAAIVRADQLVEALEDRTLP